MKMYEKTQPVEKYLNVKLTCDCGRTHYAPIKAVEIGSGALKKIPEYVKSFGYEHPYILCDKTTYEIAGKKSEQYLKQAGINPVVLILKHTDFDEATLGEIVINKPDNCDLMIGCGTGSITDMLRYSSFKLNLPCFTVATGAPMDGFSASVGIMNVNNLKATMPAHSTEVIIGDTDILESAPYRMSIAGFGDLIGKLNALNDWRLSAIVNNDHYCKNIDQMVTDYVNDIMGKFDDIKRRDPSALGDLMNALLLSGASISLYGSSRAISGAEHHMSHYWETIGDQRGKPFAMHGEQVAVATVLTLRLSEKLAKCKFDYNRAKAAALEYDEKSWENEIRLAYGKAANAIIELESESKKNLPDARICRIDRIQQNEDKVRDLLDRAYSPDKLRSILRYMGSPSDPKDIGVSPELLKNTFLYCKETRNRYTILQLAWDLGLLDALSEEIISELKNEERI